jgi:hypothetical protein
VLMRSPLSARCRSAHGRRSSPASSG